MITPVPNPILIPALKVVLMAVEEVEDHIREVVELQKMLNSTHTKNEFQAHHLEIEHADAMKLIVEVSQFFVYVIYH